MKATNDHKMEDGESDICMVLFRWRNSLNLLTYSPNQDRLTDFNERLASTSEFCAESFQWDLSSVRRVSFGSTRAFTCSSIRTFRLIDQYFVWMTMLSNDLLACQIITVFTFNYRWNDCVWVDWKCVGLRQEKIFVSLKFNEIVFGNQTRNTKLAS